MVDTKGITQPFTLKKGAEQDFSEWTHKVRTFMLTRFTWAARQRRIVVKSCVQDRLVPWSDVFGDQAVETNRIDDFVGMLYAYLVSFTTDATNRIYPERWRRPERSRRYRLVILETLARRARPNIVHAARGSASANSEPSKMPTRRKYGSSTGRLPLEEASI